MRKKIKTTCVVRDELRGNKDNLSEKKWYKLHNKLKRKYCMFENCFLCPHLVMKI